MNDVFFHFRKKRQDLRCFGFQADFVRDQPRGNIKNISVYGQDSNPTTWKLAQMNLKGSFTEVESSDVEAGRIISQSVAATETVMEETTIYFTVSIGPPESSEPDDSQSTENGENTGGGETVNGDTQLPIPPTDEEFNDD